MSAELSSNSGGWAPKPPPPPKPWARGKVLFHVEDDADFAHYVKLLLMMHTGLQVRHFNDGFRGLQELLKSRPDMVMLDLDLPTLRGDEICRLLRSMPDYKEIPILVCSSMPEAQKQEMRLLGLGADAYLEKPFNDEQFLAVVERLVTRTATTPPEMRRSVSADHTETSETSSSAKAVQRPVAKDAEAGTSFAGFDLVEIVGAGGMGTVYRAFDPALDRTVALKVLLKSLTAIRNAVERFIREGRIMEKLNHPNIIRVHGSGKTAYTYYIAMEFVEGRTLSDRAFQDDITWPEAVSIIEQLFEAVIYLHGQGILHRDLKPSNIIITPRGVVKLGDFGISRDVKELVRLNLTQDASLIGTPQFMAPEQLLGAEASELTDQYSLARTILALFEAGELYVPPKPLHEIRPELPMQLSEALQRCMHVYPTGRFPNIESARDAVVAGCRALKA